MIAAKVAFRMKEQLPEEELKKVLGELVEVFKKVPGLKTKYFLFDPKTGETGGFYIFESQEALEEYLKSDIWKNVIANATGEPKVESFVITATLDAGVLL